MGKPRNIILLVVDSLRHDSVHGQNVTLPYFEQQGIQFGEARSAACWTLPATTSLFTGLMPHEHGATAQTRGFHKHLPTLAERLKAAGYNTYQSTSNIVTTDIFGLDRGFDEVYRVWKHAKPKFPTLLHIALQFGKPRVRKTVLSKDFMFQRIAEDLSMGISWSQTTYNESFGWVREKMKENEAKGESSFFFINLMEAHFPYHVGDKFALTAPGLWDKFRESMGLYHTLNQTLLKKGHNPVKPDIEALLRERQRKGWAMLAQPINDFVQEMHQDKDNLVVFTSDHGDNFGDQGWSYHFSNVTDGGNRVPLTWFGHDHPTAEKKNHLLSSRFIHNDILRAAGIANDGPSLMDEQPETLPLLQSFWYNNDNKTLDQFKYNQLCFIEGRDRFVYRDDINKRFRWMHAPVTEPGPEEAVFQEVTETGFDPIEASVADANRKAYLRKCFSEFRVFSDKLGKENKHK